jgi:hypothetical protein
VICRRRFTFEPVWDWDFPAAHRISIFDPQPSETPSAKPQAPEKFQISKHQTPQTNAGAPVGF